MAEITAAQVKALRDRTGLPMMDCKSALAEAEGNADKAVDILRKRGAAAADKRADRETGEGRIVCCIDAAKQMGAILEFRCETAPVANNPEFKEMAEAFVKAAVAVPAGEAVTPERVLDLPLPSDPSRKCRDLLTDVVNKIRENMQVVRVERLQGTLGSYVHFNGKLGVLLQVEGAADAELLSDLCMHITAMKPTALSRDAVDPALIEKEREIARELALKSGKPAQIVDKIVEGKISRWYSENVLLDQEFANVDKFKGTVAKLLASRGNVKLVAYQRFEVGG
ncbi:MAG: translation elongation factor Ts [Phycisphaerae bacterium]|nr:translation elongation factor Ts [Phycisphaerae bacterium]